MTLLRLPQNNARHTLVKFDPCEIHECLAGEITGKSVEKFPLAHTNLPK